jgi:hypothetical protein
MLETVIVVLEIFAVLPVQFKLVAATVALENTAVDDAIVAVEVERAED